MTRPRPRCPRCGSTTAVPIVYGMPFGDDFGDADAGRIVLGGCLVGSRQPDPTHLCSACGAEFDRASGAYYVDGAPDPIFSG